MHAPGPRLKLAVVRSVPPPTIKPLDGSPCRDKVASERRIPAMSGRRPCGGRSQSCMSPLSKFHHRSSLALTPQCLLSGVQRRPPARRGSCSARPGAWSAGGLLWHRQWRSSQEAQPRRSRRLRQQRQQHQQRPVMKQSRRGAIPPSPSTTADLRAQQTREGASGPAGKRFQLRRDCVIAHPLNLHEHAVALQTRGQAISMTTPAPLQSPTALPSSPTANQPGVTRQPYRDEHREPAAAQPRRQPDDGRDGAQHCTRFTSRGWSCWRQVRRAQRSTQRCPSSGRGTTSCAKTARRGASSGCRARVAVTDSCSSSFDCAAC